MTRCKRVWALSTSAWGELAVENELLCGTIARLEHGFTFLLGKVGADERP